MTLIKLTLKITVSCRYRTVTALLCPTPRQYAKSMPNFAPGSAAIADYPTEIDAMATSRTTVTDTLRNLQPGELLQSP